MVKPPPGAASCLINGGRAPPLARAIRAARDRSILRSAKPRTRVGRSPSPTPTTPMRRCFAKLPPGFGTKSPARAPCVLRHVSSSNNPAPCSAEGSGTSELHRQFRVVLSAADAPGKWSPCSGRVHQLFCRSLLTGHARPLVQKIDNSKYTRAYLSAHREPALALQPKNQFGVARCHQFTSWKQG